MNSKSKRELILVIIFLAGAVLLFSIYKVYFEFGQVQMSIDNWGRAGREFQKVHKDRGIMFSIFSVISGFVLILSINKLKHTDNSQKDDGYCQNCGHKIVDEEKFCPECGNEIN